MFIRAPLLRMILILFLCWAPYYQALALIDPSAWYYTCFDADMDCPDQVKNGSCLGMVRITEGGNDIGFSFELALLMLSKCR